MASEGDKDAIDIPECSTRPRPAHERFQPHQLLRGHFMIDAKNLIGSGGQAYVYRTSHQLFGPVAVKLMKEQQGPMREFLLKTKMPPNPYVAQMYDFIYKNTTDLVPSGYMMECVDTSLDKVIYKTEPSLCDYTTQQAFGIIKKACAGLLYLHLHGIMHRDVKPANILVSRDFNLVKLCDHGSGQLINDRLQEVGTVGYMAPEVMVKDSNKGLVYTEKSDVYSLAITAWEILSKRAPYSGSVMQIYELVMKKLRPDLSAIFLGKKINSAFKSAWHHDPDERPSMLEINSIFFVERTFSNKRMESVLDSNGVSDLDVIAKGDRKRHWNGSCNEYGFPEAYYGALPKRNNVETADEDEIPEIDEDMIYLKPWMKNQVELVDRSSESLIIDWVKVYEKIRLLEKARDNTREYSEKKKYETSIDKLMHTCRKVSASILVNNYTCVLQMNFFLPQGFKDVNASGDYDNTKIPIVLEESIEPQEWMNEEYRKVGESIGEVKDKAMMIYTKMTALEFSSKRCDDGQEAKEAVVKELRQMKDFCTKMSKRICEVNEENQTSIVAAMEIVNNTIF